MPLINPDLYTVIISLLVIIAFLGVILYSKIREIYDLRTQLTEIQVQSDILSTSHLKLINDFHRVCDLNKELIALNKQTIERLSLSEKG